jgi:hypothetical protein
MAQSPVYSATPRLTVATVSAANTNRDGTGTIVSVITGGSSGTKITSVTTQPIVTTTAGMIRLYISSDSGSTWNLFDELPVAAATVSASVPGARNVKNYADLILPSSSHVLGASTHNAEAHRVYASGGDI